MTPAGKRIDAVLRDHLTPELRAAGFRKQGTRNYARPFPLGIQVVNVQASKWNAGSSGTFTVNLGVHLPAVAALDGVPDLPAPAEWQCHLRARIGSLLPNPHDHWWELTAGSDDTATAADLQRAWRDCGPGWFAARERPADLVAVTARAFPWLGCRVALALGDHARAAELWTAARVESSGTTGPAVDAVEAFGRRHGLLATVGVPGKDSKPS